MHCQLIIAAFLAVAAAASGPKSAWVWSPTEPEVKYDRFTRTTSIGFDG